MVCTITTTIRDASGAAKPGAKIVFQPGDPSLLRGVDTGTEIGTPVEAVANGAGVLTVTLQPGHYIYSTIAGPTAVRGKITVPDRVAVDLEDILLTPDGPYEIVTWAAFQLLVANATPYASIAAGLAAVAEGVAFVASSDDQLVLVRKVSGQPVNIFIDV